MPSKDIEKRRASSRRHYEANKAAMKARARRHSDNQRSILRLFLKEYKESKSCRDCDIFFPHFVMEFDHIGDDKSFNIGGMSSAGVGLATLKREIAKCELVCANCHRLRTWTRGGKK